MRDRMPRTVESSRNWFLGENGSIEGGMMATRPAGIHDGTYSRRENTKPLAEARCGRRKAQAASVVAFCQSTPMWQRQATCAPALVRYSVSPAVCGSCSSTRSPGLMWSSNSTALAASIRA